MASIVWRPLDLLIVLCFAFFFMVVCMIDFTQSVYGPIIALKNTEKWTWPPPFVLQSYAWWCETYDPLVAHCPMWLETMSWFAIYLYAPFYLIAIYAFVFEKEWIRVPAMLWAYGLLLTMFVVAREELFGEYAAPDPKMFLAAYGSFVMIPTLVLLRVAWTPVFSGPKNKRD